MLAILLLAVLQPSDFVALDDAHQAWLRCVLPAAQRLAGRGETAAAAAAQAYRACAREEAAVRAVLARLHPGAPAADLDDILAQFRRRSAYLVQAAIAQRR